MRLFRKSLATVMAASMALPAGANDHLIARVNYPGVQRILTEGLVYAHHVTHQRLTGQRDSHGQPTWTRPSRPILSNQRIGRTIPAAQLNAHPFYQLASQLTNVDQFRDRAGNLPFSIHMPGLYVNWNVPPNTIVLEVEEAPGNNPNRFLVETSFALDELRVDIGGRVSVCLSAPAQCPRADLKVSALNPWLALNRRVTVRGKFLVTLNPRGTATVALHGNIRTNLAQAQLRVSAGNARDIQLPPVTIEVNGRTATVDTSAAAQLIADTVSREVGPQIVSSTAAFIQTQLGSLIQQTLRRPVNTRLDVLSLDEAGIRSRLDATLRDLTTATGPAAAQRIIDDLAKVLRHASLGIELNGMPTTQQNRAQRSATSTDIEARARMHLTLNQNSASVANTYRAPGGREESIQRLELGHYSNPAHHVSLAFSEPTLNAALNLFEEMGVYKSVILALAKNDNGRPMLTDIGFKLHSHFVPPASANSNGSIKLVAEIELDLRDLENFPGVTIVGGLLRAFRGGPIIRFPLEFEARPRLVQDGQFVKLLVDVTDPFQPRNQLVNTYNYTNEMPDAGLVVRNAFMSVMRSKIAPLIARPLEIPLGTILSQGPMQISPKDFKVLSRGYLMMSGDISRLAVGDFAPDLTAIPDLQ